MVWQKFLYMTEFTKKYKSISPVLMGGNSALFPGLIDCDSVRTTNIYLEFKFLMTGISDSYVFQRISRVSIRRPDENEDRPQEADLLRPQLLLRASRGRSDGSHRHLHLLLLLEDRPEGPARGRHGQGEEQSGWKGNQIKFNLDLCESGWIGYQIIYYC